MKVAIKERDGKITIGTVPSATVGELVKVDLRDEDDDMITADGVVVEILED